MAHAAKIVVMNAAPAVTERHVDLLDAFTERAEACAYLWSIGEYELQKAVDVLQHDAMRDGLIDRIGQDGVQAILADAFRPYQESSDADPFERITNEFDEKPKHDAPAASTVEAFGYLVRQNDPVLLRAWLARHNREERAAFKNMLISK
jgi:hypothetical protein